MNKFDEYIYEYLMLHKQMSLEGIGNFYIGSTTPKEHESSVFTNSAIQFEYNNRAITENLLIDFLVPLIGKSKSLVASDFYSYLDQIRSFINIGKSYEIPGIGVLTKNNSGAYELLPLSQKSDLIKQPKAKINTHEVVNSKREVGRGFIKYMSVAIIFIVLGGLSWGAYSLFLKNSNWTSDNGNRTIINNIDSIDNNIKTQDSAQIISNSTIKGVNDSLHCLFLQEVTPSLLRAKTRTEKLNSFGHHAGYDSSGNKGYRIFTLHTVLSIDTLHLKDSLERYFKKKIFIEVIN